MTRARVLLSTALTLFPLTLGCGSSSSPSQPSTTCTNGTMVANEANNYSFSSSLMLHPVKVKPMSDLTFDWSGVTKDFLGHTVNPKTDLNAIFLLMVNTPVSEFEKQLNDDTFSTSSIVIPGPPPSYLPMNGETSKSLYDNFVTGDGPATADLANQYLDASKYNASNTTFAIAAQSGTNVGTGQIHMLQSFELDSSSTNTTVAMTNGSTTLTYTANLHGLHPTGVPTGVAGLTLDWGSIQKNALGGTFVPTNIAHAIVGHYTQTPAQLETQFLDLETIAQTLYSTDIPSGTVLDFTTLIDSAGHPFPGIDSSGTWLVALVCTTCRNPAPWYLTILEPAPQPCK
jgi:hypothetical protein